MIMQTKKKNKPHGKLDRACKRNGITLYRLQRDCGLTHPMIYLINSGRVNATLAVASRIAERLGSTIEELFEP